MQNLNADEPREFRLELQYKSWQANIGYLLHGAIEQHGHMRIADVGTGTGLVNRYYCLELKGISC